MTKPGLELVDGRIEAAFDRPFRVAIFDFDDTLSLLRSGWQEVMISQAMEVLSPLAQNEGLAALREYIATYVDQLTGLPTIHQMARLAEECAQRGGSPRQAEAYKQEYTECLLRIRDERVQAIVSGALPASAMTVACAKPLLEALTKRGMQLVVASGTDDDAVQREIRLLGLDQFFAPHIYGAPLGDTSFSKGRVFDAMIRQFGVQGSEIVGFGDGVVEIQETRRVGGLAIGVAKWSAEHPEEFARHRRRLIDAGAQAIIPDYESIDAILSLLELKPPFSN